MSYKKALLTATAVVLMGAGCSVAPATAPTDQDDQGSGSAVNSAVPAPGNLGSSTDVDEMIVVDEGSNEPSEDGTAGIPTPSADAGVTARNVAITFDGSGYAPNNVSINVGDTVTFRNNSTKSIWPASSVHPVHNVLPGFDARKSIAGGESYNYTFTKAGSWQWHDHRRASLGGTITVK